jgi:hypothetical protein
LVKWVFAPIVYFLFCAAGGTLLAWATHGNQSEQVFLAVSVVTYVLLGLMGIALGCWSSSNVLLKSVLVLCFLAAGYVVLFVTGVSVACGPYDTCF